MRLIKGQTSTGFAGAKHEWDFEDEDDATDGEIEETAEQIAFENIDWSYWEVTDDEKNT